MNPSLHRLRNAILAFALVVLILDLAHGLVWISPDAHTKSQFLRNYNPMVLLATFQAPCSPGVRSGLQVGTSTFGSAGYAFLTWRKDVEHRITVEPTYCADSQN